MNRKERRTVQSQSSSKATDSAEAHFKLGYDLHLQRRYDEALMHYNRATVLNPDYADAFSNGGVIFQEMHRYEEALGCYDKTLDLKPDHFMAHNNRGIILQKTRRYNDAEISFTKAIALKPDYVEAYNNLGTLYHAMQRYDEALTCFDKSIALNPAYGPAYFNRGTLLKEMKRPDEALEDYKIAAELQPDIPYLTGDLLYVKMELCDWQHTQQIISDVAKAIEEGKPASDPFILLSTPLSIAYQQKAAQIYIQNKFPASNAPLWKGERYTHERIHIGYFSSDFRTHALSYLMAEYFEIHDRSKFEVTAFALGPSSDDAVRARLQNAFEHLIDISAMSDREVAMLARSREIDIAVDLNGFTTHARTGIFAMRPAPVQISYMGYPATMGSPYIDYIVADKTVIPEENGNFFSEKIIRLPDTYWVTDSTRKLPAKQFTRAEAGLPEEAFVFCCFNNSYKISPDAFDIWMRLLLKVEGSVLWLLETSQTAKDALRHEAEARGVSGTRIIFAPRMSIDDHLARHRLADLFLDTLYYNAHTTASDALKMDLPIVTCIGNTFPSRVAASLLQAAHMPELITHSHAEYEALALELATNPQKLAAIKQKLAENQATCPLFDTKRFTKNMEKAFVKIWEHQQAGLPPNHIYIDKDHE